MNIKLVVILLVLVSCFTFGVIYGFNWIQRLQHIREIANNICDYNTQELSSPDFLMDNPIINNCNSNEAVEICTLLTTKVIINHIEVQEYFLLLNLNSCVRLK